MVLLNWLSILGSQARPERQLRKTKRIERRLRLMRLEQRRVLNADFTFAAAMGLSLTHVDGDLSMREVSGHIEFDLSGSVWHDTGSSGLHVDNSVANHSILSVAKADLHALSVGISIVGADSTHQLTFDTQSAALDLQFLSGTLAVQDFGDVHQIGSNTLSVNDFSVTASTRIELRHLSGDDITLSASEIDFTGGAHSVSGTTLSILSNSASSMELGGGTDHASLLDFTDTDIAALNGHFQSITF